MYVLIHIKYELVYHQNHVRIRSSIPPPIWVLCSTIRTPYLCKLFLDYFITFVFLFFLFWSKCQTESQLFGRCSSSLQITFQIIPQGFIPQKVRLYTNVAFFEVYFDRFVVIKVDNYETLALVSLSAISKKDQYIFHLILFGVTLESWKVTLIRAQCRLQSCNVFI